MAQFDHSHLKVISKGVHLFNAQKYWECHEELEHHWLEDQSPMRNVYWAVIQVAAAMIHYRDGNLEGAKGLISKAQKKFKRCEELKVESDVLEQKLSWSLLKKLTMDIPEKPKLSDFEKLFEFRFKEMN